MLKKLFPLLVALALILISCTPATSEIIATPIPEKKSAYATSPASQRYLQQQSTLQAGASATPTPELALRVERSGGLSGETIVWEIYSDGIVVTTRQPANSETKARMIGTELAKLLEKVKTQGFFELQESYTSSGQCNDCYHTTIFASIGGRSHQVSVDSGANDTPQAFWDVLDAVLSTLGVQ